MLALPGYFLLKSLHDLASLLRIHDANARELSAWLGRTDDVSELVKVWNADDRTELERHLDESVRLFFNFATSTLARVDHYRAVRNRGHLDGDFGAEYEARVERVFRQDPLHHWMVGARRFMLHHSLPIARGRMRITRGDQETVRTASSIVVETSALLDSESFDSLARASMAGRDDIDLRDAVHRYDQTTRAFDEWFGEAFRAAPPRAL